MVWRQSFEQVVGGGDQAPFRAGRGSAAPLEAVAAAVELGVGEHLTGRGTTVLIPPDAGKRKGSRPGWDGGRYAFMRRVLATEHGSGLYAKRQA